MVWIQPFRSRDLGVLSQREIPTYNKQDGGWHGPSISTGRGEQARHGKGHVPSQTIFQSLGSFLGLLVLSDFL